MCDCVCIHTHRSAEQFLAFWRVAPPFFYTIGANFQKRLHNPGTLQHTATHCNKLQHTAIHCNTLQHTATHSNILQHTATLYNTLQYTATNCNTLQHTATLGNTLQHTAAHSMTKEPYKYRTHSAKKPNNAWSLLKSRHPNRDPRATHGPLHLCFFFHRNDDGFPWQEKS